MDGKIRWGILATGSIADTFASDLKHSHYGVLFGVASRSFARAQAFCAACPRTPAAAYCPPANLQVKGQHSEARAAKAVSAA